MLGSHLRLTACAEELAEAHVSVWEVGEFVEEALAQSLSLVELAGVNQVDGAVGQLVEPLAIVVDDRLPEGAGSADGGRWCVAPLLLAGGNGGGLIRGQAALLVLLAAAAGTGLVTSDLGHGVHVSLLKLFDAATFYHVLERIDAELAEATRRARCPRCKGVLHKASYPRKPRGGPADLPASYGVRASYCCAVEGCRTRATPPSVRFLARRVYLGAVVVLASALQHGVSAFRVRRLTELFGASRQTLLRWRSWWLEAFAASRFWQSLRGRVMPAVDEAMLPCSLLERFEGSSGEGGAMAALLGVLQPISTRPWLSASAS
jgi:hypothetical protein